MQSRWKFTPPSSALGWKGPQKMQLGYIVKIENEFFVRGFSAQLVSVPVIRSSIRSYFTVFYESRQIEPILAALFSRGHATLELALSESRSVGHIFELRAVFALLRLPNRPRLDCRVSGLVRVYWTEPLNAMTVGK